VRALTGRARAQLAGLPRAMWVCAAVGVVNAACWAVITPTFWVPDEPAHVGYVQYVAETGKLPRSGFVDPDRPEGPSGEQSAAYNFLPFRVTGKPVWEPAEDRALRRELRREQSNRANDGQALNATSNPPLYYALETIPYRIVHGAGYLDRVLAMRLFSALFAGFTVLFTYLFLRQLLPGTQWAWTTGALAVAFQPVLGFMSGGVNADALAYPAAAAVLWTLARAFRQGLNIRTGAAIGAAMAVGLFSKPIVIGLIPGLVLAFAILVIRQSPRRPAALGAAAALAPTVVTYAAYTALSAHRVTLQPPAPGVGGPVGGDALTAEISYVWQSLLPRLPFMNDQFATYPLWEVYFKGFIGRLGWNEYGFASGWYWVALLIFAGILALAGRALWERRATVWSLRWELATYVALTVGLAISVAIVGYGYLRDTGIPFEQARYLFPVLALYGALMAVAAMGAGRRWGPAVGALLVVLAMGQSLFAQLLTLGRFYT